MKKFAPIALITLIGALTMTSCKKDYTCNCSYNGASVYTYTIHAKKSDAKSACTAYTSTVAGQSWSCALK